MNKIYGYDTNIYETSIGNIKHINDEEYLSNILKDFKGNLVEYIEQLKQKAELADHYKHLYSEVKKQKDDVVEIIKRQLLSNTNITKYTDEMCLRHVLRMLGERDE